MAEITLFDSARAAEVLRGRWESDPLRRWMFGNPGAAPKQQMFLDCTKPEAALLGANRSGKSDPLAALVSSYTRLGNPNPRFAYSSNGTLAVADRAVSVWVIGLTEKLMKEGIQPKIVTTAYTAAETHPAFIPPHEIDGWNINDQTWRLKNGSFITFKTADAGREVFQSAARDLVAFDEICEWEIYKEATFRVGGNNRRLLIRLAATLLPPVGMAGGVSWYFPQKIKPWWASGNKENTPDNQNPDPYLDIFTMGMRENPGIHPEEIARLRSMFPPDSLESRIRIDGELLATIGGSLAYSAYNQQIHYDLKVTPENRDYRYPLCLCVDFNVEPCMWVIGQYIDNCWFFFDEITQDNCSINSMAQEFRQRYPHHGAEVRIYGDATGKARSPQSGKSHYYLLAEAFKGYPAPVVQYIPDTGNPPIIDRINAVNRALMGPDGRIGIVVGPNCPELAADFSEVLKSNDGKILKTKHAESPYYRRTHASDAAGYAVCYVNPVPRFIATERSRVHSIPSPGYLGRGGKLGYGRAGMPPADYNADGKLRRTHSGTIMPPRRP